MPKARAGLIAAVLIAAGVLARAVLLTSASCWNDEASTLMIARLPIAGIAGHLARAESNAPLYYWLMHFWLRPFSDGLLGLRLFSLLCGAVCLPLFWRLCCRLSSRPPVAALALACFASSWIHASQDGRVYALVLLFALVDILLAWDLAWGWSPRACAGLSLVAVLGLCCHYHFAFLLLGNAVFFLVRFHRQPGELARRWAALAPAALVALALLRVLGTQVSDMRLSPMLREPLSAAHFCEIMGQFLFDPSFLGLALRPLMTVIGAAALAGIAIASLQDRGGEQRAWAFVLIQGAASLIGLRACEWSLSLALSQARYLLLLSPLFFWLVSDALARLRPRGALFGAGGAVVLAGTICYYTAIWRLDPHLDRIAARIRHLPGRPPIVHLQPLNYLEFRYYYLPEYRNLMLSDKPPAPNAQAQPGGPDLIAPRDLARLGSCIVIDPAASVFPHRWGSATGPQLAQALGAVAR